MKRILIAIAAAALVLAGCAPRQTAATSGLPSPALTQTTPDPENAALAREFLQDCGNYYLATVEGDQPRVRPFGTAEVLEGKLYIQTGKVKNVYKQLVANPRAEICAYNGSEWIRIQCELIPDERVEIKQAMLDLNPSLKGQYSADDDNTIVFFLRNATATISSFSGDARSFQF